MCICWEKALFGGGGFGKCLCICVSLRENTTFYLCMFSQHPLESSKWLFVCCFGKTWNFCLHFFMFAKAFSWNFPVLQFLTTTLLCLSFSFFISILKLGAHIRGKVIQLIVKTQWFTLVKDHHQFHHRQKTLQLAFAFQ